MPAKTLAIPWLPIADYVNGVGGFSTAEMASGHPRLRPIICPGDRPSN